MASSSPNPSVWHSRVFLSFCFQKLAALSCETWVCSCHRQDRWNSTVVDCQGHGLLGPTVDFGLCTASHSIGQSWQ